MTHSAQPFVILADTKTGVARQTRLSRASAMCLADTWAEAGHENVRIIDSNGVERDRSQFRETLKIVKQARLYARSGLTAAPKGSRW